ncbi:N-acetylmuramoyl-L-alanine amidase family protein [Haliangium sp.]|uniref:N-acetylmuramoyl-L-alanine amidase family protein n=1 Tax=Haliangium sp. TaxID=2663208 RepID=UPI003D0C2DD2
MRPALLPVLLIVGAVGLVAEGVPSLAAGPGEAPPQTTAAATSAPAGDPAATDPLLPTPPLIVLDPGHGGSNTGAPGAVPGVYEKQITLALARLLWEALDQRGYRVLLTRDRDQYLTLRQRVRLANRVGADLFISLHTNATPQHTRRGYETFVLPPAAVDIDSRALRLEDGAPRPGVERETALLLDDLERGLAVSGAADLAGAIQSHMRQVRDPEHDRGVRQGAMDVLYGATMPAVLVEVGFIDHPDEGRQLTDPAVQAQIAQALARAVSDVLPLETVTTAAPEVESSASAE